MRKTTDKEGVPSKGERRASRLIEHEKKKIAANRALNPLTILFGLWAILAALVVAVFAGRALSSVPLGWLPPALVLLLLVVVLVVGMRGDGAPRWISATSSWFRRHPVFFAIPVIWLALCSVAASGLIY